MLLGALGALGAGCLDEPACRSAMGHMYDVNGAGYCVLIINPIGEIQSEDEAVEWCYEIEAQAAECGCEDEFFAMIDCLETHQYPDCQECDPPLTALQLCAQCVANQ
ncbi:MAG: hypothetical protein ABI333_15665 [bacterium]